MRHDSLAKVTVPTNLDIRNFETAIEAKYPALSNCWGAMDGLKLRLERAGNQRIQNMFYNGWTHDHYVSNLFLFSPDGKIRACYINAPGTLHDSTMANMSMVCRLVDNLYGRLGSKIVVDSAFASDGRPSLYNSHQQNFDGHGNQRQNSLLHRQATSVWECEDYKGPSPV